MSWKALTRPLPQTANTACPLWNSSVILPGCASKVSTFGATSSRITLKPGSMFFSPPPFRRAIMITVCRP